MNKDHSHSWVRISHGNKLVTNLNNKEQDDNEQDTSEMQFEDCALKSNARAFASRSKAKAEPQRRTSANSSTNTILVGERIWTDIEPQDYSSIDYPVLTQLSTLLRQGHLPRGDDGAIEFWRLKDCLRYHLCILNMGLMKSGRAAWQEEEETRKDFSIVLIFQEKFFTLELSLQENVVIPDGFFKYIYHVGCPINLHSIINSGLISGGQNFSKRQTVFFLLVDLMDKEHKDLDTIDLRAPRLAQYMQTAWKRHEEAKNWVDIKLAQQKGLKFYQTRLNAFILHETLTAYCFQKVVRMEIGAVIYEKVYASPRSPPKISLKHDWMKDLGSEVARQTERFQPTQPNPNPIHRTGRLVETEQTSFSSAQEIDARFSLDCESTNLSVERLDKDKDTDKDVDADRVRTVRPVVGHWSHQFEEIDIDFRVSGLPHAVVKQAENSRVRELVKKIESHPHRQGFQADLQQSNVCNPVIEKIKEDDSGHGQCRAI